MKLAILSVLILSFCFLHSFLISKKTEKFMRHILGRKSQYYRILYNVFSSIYFLFVVYYISLLPENILFSWEGHKSIQYLLFSLGIVIFFFGAKQYNLMFFVGLQQIKSATSSDNQSVQKNGILGWIRHPFYTGTFFLLWARTVSDISILTNTILTLYLIVGTFLEEKKMIEDLGSAYIDYRKDVSMFFPIKKVASLIKRL